MQSTYFCMYVQYTALSVPVGGVSPPKQVVIFVWRAVVHSAPEAAATRKPQF